jgi:hypothetical protein
MTAWKTLVVSALGLAVMAGYALGAPAAGAGSDQASPTRARAAVPQPASVVGAAWNADGSGIPGARLRLRNVVTGKIQATATADDSGQFRFETVSAGTYVIELVDETGKGLALGHVFAIGPAETIATFVRIGTRVPWYTGFFSNAAAAVISTAASEGITALAPVARPVSRKQ